MTADVEGSGIGPGGVEASAAEPGEVGPSGGQGIPVAAGGAEGGGAAGSERFATLKDEGGLWIRAVLRADGALVFKGQDLRGGDEYEYALTVLPQDVTKVVAGLGGAAGDDPLGLLVARADAVIGKGELTWLRSVGVEPDFWSWVS